MKIGFNDIEKKIIESFLFIHYWRGVRKFAFLPVGMFGDGDYVWLESYWKQSRMTYKRQTYREVHPPFEFEANRPYARRKRYVNEYHDKQANADIDLYMFWVEQNYPHLLKYAEPQPRIIRWAKDALEAISR